MSGIKIGVNIFSFLMITVFLLVLIMEGIALVGGMPEVYDNIVHPHVSTESDIIVEKCDNSSITLKPEVNGTSYSLENHTIFTHEEPLEDGRIYHLSCGHRDVYFRAVKPKNLDYIVVGGFKDHIVIAFNRELNHSDVESLIYFQPNVTYSTRWYHNTLVIEPDARPYEKYRLRIQGNLSTEKKGINISATFIGGYGIEKTIIEPNSVPSYPVTYTFIILPPGIPAITGLLSGQGFLIYYLFIVASILASLLYLGIRYGRRTWKDVERFRRNLSLKIPSKNPAFEIGALFFASISFTVIFYYIAEIFNPHPTVPDFSRMKMWEQMYGLARAGVWEELITRIPFIGIPLLLIHLFRGKRSMPLYRYVLGGEFEMDRLTLLLITICGLMFGIVHMLGGWDAFKILPAMAGGMAMGYLYARYGIWASIILHFSIDYLTIPAYVFDLPSLNIAMDLFIFIGVFIGLYFLYIYSNAFIMKFFGKKGGEKSIRAGMEPPRVYKEEWERYGEYGIPYAQYPYRCYRCGNTEGEYIGDGLLRCTRCGALSRLPPFPPPRA